MIPCCCTPLRLFVPSLRRASLSAVTVVIITLLKTLIPQKPCEGYGVMLDNLFTFTKLLIYLSAEGFGAHGTTRINAGVYQDLINFKKSDTNNIIPWGTRHLRYIIDGVVTQLG